jgi:hypothetical protein
MDGLPLLDSRSGALLVVARSDIRTLESYFYYCDHEVLKRRGFSAKT